MIFIDIFPKFSNLHKEDKYHAMWLIKKERKKERKKESISESLFTLTLHCGDDAGGGCLLFIAAGRHILLEDRLIWPHFIFLPQHGSSREADGGMFRIF